MSYTEHEYTYWAARCRGEFRLIYLMSLGMEFGQETHLFRKHISVAKEKGMQICVVGCAFFQSN